MSTQQDLQETIEKITQEGKGILAADESNPTIAKRFKAIGLETSEENRRAWRSLILNTPKLSDHISGIILFEETLSHNSEDGTPLPELALKQGILPGIKVDLGTTPLVNAPGDLITQGLDGLKERLIAYKERGAVFAKWREVYSITNHTPSPTGIIANADTLARYAAICQSVGVVPIVEPEVLIDGKHSIDTCFDVIEAVHRAVFQSLWQYRVCLEHIILKPSMVTPGKDSSLKASPEQVADYTVKQFRRSVPAAVPSINFLSGGQSNEEASANLNAMNAIYPDAPWDLSFSYGRALQQPGLQAWEGKIDNVESAQNALYHRARLNGAARLGQYKTEMEND